MGTTGKERASRAFEAMEELGLEKKFISPILRALLKVYNNEWSYIEAENYRLLADQAFDQQETMVNPEAPPSPRQTRASVAASTSSAERGKKPIVCRDTRSSEKRPPREERPRMQLQEVAAKSPVGAGRGSAKPPLIAKVKIEKGTEGPFEPVVKTSAAESVGIKPIRVKQECSKSNASKLGQSSPSCAPVSPGKVLDAQTLEETLRRVASTSQEMSKETRSTGVENGTHLTVSPPDEKTCPQTSRNNDKSEQAVEKVEPIHVPAKKQQVPCSCTSKVINGHQVLENSASGTSCNEAPALPEPSTDNSRGAEIVNSGELSCPKAIAEKSQWLKPVTDGANVLLLLADIYAEDEEEPPVPVQLNELQSGELTEEVELPIRPNCEVMNMVIEERQEQPAEPIEIDLVDVESPERPLDMLPSVEERPDHVDTLDTDLVHEPAIGTPERIRPWFIVIKKEVPAAADENSQTISGLTRQQSEDNPANLKRELSDPEETTHQKRVKYETEPEASGSLPNGCVDINEVALNSNNVSESKENCTTTPGAATELTVDCTKGNLTTAASPSPVSSRKELITVDMNSSGGRRRKFIIPESPSPEASPVSEVHANDHVSGTMKTNACPTSVEVVEVEPVTSTMKTNGALASGSSEVLIPECVTAAIAVVNTVMSPEDFDDELHGSRRKLAHLPGDISRGTENVCIPYVNEYSTDTIPALFKYIPVNTVFQDAYVNFSLARVGEEDCCGECFGDCLKAPYPCTCTRETGGVFAYTKDGLLKDEYLQHEVDSMQNEEFKEKLVTFCQSGWDCPIERAKSSVPETCKGHLSRKFIKECWHKCGCSMECGNRVVQRGISRKLQIFFTQEGKGWGLRTLEQLPPGAFVCEYVGEVMTNIELDKRNHAQKGDIHTYPILLDGDWCSEKDLKDEEALCLDATNFGNAARFINHRCFDANLIDMPVTIESPDRHYYHVAFFTSRAVRANEELTWDYKIDFDDDEHPIEAFRCLCKSPFCRGPSGKKHKKSRNLTKKS